jgi:hypothetical protein
MKLHLGVIDRPYENASPDGSTAATTTGEVAQWLENRYHIMEIFYHFHEQEIADKLAEGMADALEAVMVGAAGGTGKVEDFDPFAEALSEEEEIFKFWLALGEVEKVGIPGVPTLAAQNRQSLRLKLKKKLRGPARPSFIDTGLYQSSFKMWVEDE